MGDGIYHPFLHMVAEKHMMDPKKKYQLFKQNNNFCTCPWTNAQIYTNGDVKTCSIGTEVLGNVNESDILEILTKSNTLKRIRTNMLNDTPDPNCVVCQYRSIDDDNFVYLKDHYNSRIKNDDVDYDDIENFDLRFIDLHWSNICNLRCVMCHPEQSSLIAKDENFITTPVNQKNIKKIREMIIKNQTRLKEIYLSGGEPFYIPYNFTLLEEISNKDIPIRVNSNMHWQQNNKVFKALLKFKNVQLTMSVDALNEKFGYIRNGADWDTFTKNLEFVKTHTNFDIRINTIFSIINAIDICNLIKYFFAKDIRDITINLCTTPSPIDARNYPKNKKSKIVGAILDLIKTMSPDNVNLISNLKNCINRLQLDNEGSYEDCLDQITRKHKISWRSVFKDLI